MIAHVLAAPYKPEIAKSTRAGCVIPQVRVAKSTEGMKAAPFDSEFFQNRVQAAAQDVALSERFSLARAENVSKAIKRKGEEFSCSPIAPSFSIKIQLVTQ